MTGSKHGSAQTFCSNGLFHDLASFGQLEEQISALPTPKERGDAFEVFAEAFLATQKRSEVKEIWPEKVIPPALCAKLNLSERKGVGIDGLYETVSGDFYAYQVKFRANRPRLGWNEIGGFYGISAGVDQRLLFTNCNAVTSEIDTLPNSISIRGYDLDRLTPGDFEAIHRWLESGIVEVERKTPDPHQVEALDVIVPALREHDRFSAIMACGTGKTLVALWAAEQLGCKTVLILEPSLALIQQTLPEWLRQTNWPNVTYLCVCSDLSVQRDVDQIIMRPSEMDFPVNTDSDIVSEFLGYPFDGVKVVFSTYQSAQVIADGMDREKPFDLAIFDEAHKTAGKEGKKNSLALSDDNLPIRKRLFMTATPRHYSPRKRTKEGDQAVAFSMDDPKVYGPLESRYELTFAEAARQSIICDYKIIISIITSETVNNELLSRGEVLIEGDSVRARQVANQLAIKTIIDNYPVKKIFSFHGRVRSAKSFTSELPEGINTILPDLPAFHVNGEMRVADRLDIMKEFKAGPKGVISNARCLTEGVDVPAVDMVAFMSPKKSTIDIVQATGRAMRIPRENRDKTTGYVFIPLYIEQERNETEEEALERMGFEELVDVLNAMKEQDDVLADIIHEMREGKGRVGGYDDSRFKEKIEMLGPGVSLDTLRQSITATCVERLGSTWDERFGELVAYQEQHGHYNVPQGWPENPKLGSWVDAQRQLYRTEKLSQRRIDRLNAISFVWDPRDIAWEEMFEALVTYKKQHGNCNVPQAWLENPKLGSWADTQRQSYKTEKLSQERIDRLNAIGFAWNTAVAAWEEMFEALVAYKEHHGHCDAPRRWLENPKLSTWIDTQRQSYNTEKLSQERIDRLNAIGFVWNTVVAAWEKIFEALEAYKEQHDHCNVPVAWSENPQLGKWCNKQRVNYKDHKLAQERVDRLNAIGFVWNIVIAAWEENFDALVAYKDQHGDCDVPYGSPENQKLRNWIDAQRNSHKAEKLLPERRDRLETIGLTWDPQDIAWEEMFEVLVAYKNQHGHCNVPRGWPENPKLHTWVNNQRGSWSAGNLPRERKDRLEAIGLVWNVIDARWGENFDTLVDHKEQHGDCNVLTDWPENPILGRWVNNQRRAYKNNMISREHTDRLNAIGFVWDPSGTVWEEMFEALVAYKQTHGHCNVPRGLQENPRLSTWVNTQRRLFKVKKLSQERINHLNTIGFVWNTIDARWEEMFEALVVYKDQHGNCEVPRGWPTNPKLARWVKAQRAGYNSSPRTLFHERIDLLNTLEFKWTLRKN